MAGETKGSADFAEVAGHILRMRLDRWWSDEPRALVCGCNPSMAGADVDDPTIRSVVRLTRRLPGIGGVTMVNWLPYVATAPADLHNWRGSIAWNSPDTWRTICAMNVRLISDLSETAGLRFVAWGNLVPEVPHTTAVLLALSLDGAHELHAFGQTKDGSPKHPLARGKHRIREDDQPVVWRPARPVTETEGE